MPGCARSKGTAFSQLIQGTAYAPYWWEVRLFAPGEITESMLRFRPDGSPYGFVLKVPETFAPADPNAFRNYTERYSYDRLGNFRSLAHQASVGGGFVENWTRNYEIDGANSNRMLSTSQSGAESGPHYSLQYLYDAAGKSCGIPVTALPPPEGVAFPVLPVVGAVLAAAMLAVGRTTPCLEWTRVWTESAVVLRCLMPASRVTLVYD